MKVINKVALAVIRDRRVLMVKSKKNKYIYYSLGGKIENGETDLQCIIREVLEEVGASVSVQSCKYLAIIEAPAHDKPNTIVQVKLYTGDITGKLLPSNEVDRIAFFDSSMPKKNRSVLGDIMLELLLKRGYIN